MNRQDSKALQRPRDGTGGIYLETGPTLKLAHARSL